MKPLTKTITLAFSLFILGLLLGSRVGVGEFQKADAQYKAALLAHQIIGLKGPKHDEQIEVLEISLNAALANHGRFLESHWNWFWTWPYYLMQPDDQTIKFAVRYRINNPYQAPNTSDISTWQDTGEYSSQELKAFAQELRDAQMEQERLIKLVINKYTQ